MTACDPCLRRALLIAMLAGRISGLLNRPRSRVAGLLGLAERELLEVAGGPRAELVAQALSERDLDADRDAFERTGVMAVCRHSRH